MKRLDGVGVAAIPLQFRDQQHQLPLLSIDAAAALIGHEAAVRFTARGRSLVEADESTFARGFQIGHTPVRVRRLYQSDRGEPVTVGRRVYVRLQSGRSMPIVDGLTRLAPLGWAPQFLECEARPDIDVLQVLEMLRNDERVAHAEADLAIPVTLRQNLPAEALAVWPFEDMHVKSAWSVTKGDLVRVAVLDTGFAVDHPDLASQIDPLAAAFVGDGSGGTPVVTVGDLTALGAQNTSHGTHCAALIAGALNDRFGCGIAPRARIVPIAVDAEISEAGLSRAIAYAVKPSVETGQADVPGCDVISCSLGFDVTAVGEVLAEALAFAEQNGVVVCWAVANEAGPVDAICRQSTVMGIGASMRNGDRRQGATGDGLFCVAPGDSVASAVPDGDLFEEMSGSSVSTAIVAGVCALARSAARQSDVELSAANLRRVIEDACDRATPTAQFGHGRLDAGAAVEAVVAMLT